jgi:hypothetical protein
MRYGGIGGIAASRRRLCSAVHNWWERTVDCLSGERTAIGYNVCLVGIYIHICPIRVATADSRVQALAVGIDMRNFGVHCGRRNDRRIRHESGVRGTVCIDRR